MGVSYEDQPELIPPGHGEPRNVGARPGDYCHCGRPIRRAQITPGVTLPRCDVHGYRTDETWPTSDEWPTHRPFAPEAPIPGTHHYSGCDPDRPVVHPTGVCLGCGGTACPRCGYELCQCDRPAHERS